MNNYKIIDEIYIIRSELNDLIMNIFIKDDYKVESEYLERIVYKINILLDRLYKVDNEVNMIISDSDEDMMILSRCNLIKQIIGG